jgi:anti-sigma factor RsiW
MTDLVCVSGVDLLVDYLEGALASETREAIERHVAGCPKCVAFLASYRETPRILRDATAVAMPKDLQQSVRAKLRGL